MVGVLTCPSCGSSRVFDEYAEEDWGGGVYYLMTCVDCEAEWLLENRDGEHHIDGDSDYEEEE